MKKCICALVLVLTVAAAWSEDTEHHRGFILEVGGGGFSYLTYGSAADSVLSSYASSTGADRIKIFINLDLGWAISETTYLVIGAEGFGDGFFAGSSSLDQLNSDLLSIGIRYYPFVTGLVLGVDVGTSKLDVTSNASGVGSTPYSPGVGLSLAWDFGGRPTTAFTVEIGIRALYLSVSDPLITSMTGVTPFINLVIK